MRKFIHRALDKLDKLDSQQIRKVLSDLARENERLEIVLASMTDGVIVVDAADRLLLCNKAAERLVPFAKTEIFEKKLWTVIDDEEIAGFVHRTLERQDTVVEREFPLSAGGQTRIIAFTVLPLVANGKIQGNLFHVEEVTEKRGKEARLRRAESLASLTTLAAGVAHEIKNPLGSMGIHIQLLQKAIKDRKAVAWDSVEKFIAVINEEIERLNKIVVDFLFAVRPIDVHLEEQELNPLVHELLEFVRYELEQAGIKIKENLEDSLPKLCLDGKYMKQALLNIVKNAMAAMPEGGVLTVRTKRRNNEVLLAVADTGMGISRELMGKIFEPYFTTREFGSGIGLTVVYKIVKEHQGEISVDSQEGLGSTFTISLPVPQREQHLLDWQGEEAGIIQ